MNPQEPSNEISRQLSIKAQDNNNFLVNFIETIYIIN